MCGLRTEVGPQEGGLCVGGCLYTPEERLYSLGVSLLVLNDSSFANLEIPSLPEAASRVTRP